MKALLIAAVGTAMLGLVSMSAPATAMPMQGIHSGNVSSIESVLLHRRPVCHNQRIVRRGPHGRRIVSTKRVCH